MLAFGALSAPVADATVLTSCPASPDPDAIFADGFERGDLCLWSQPVGCTSSSELAAVLAGGTPPLAIERVTVTYLLPAIGGADAAFFVQAEPEGPAVMVDVDPATLSPVPAIGDLVSFQVDGTTVSFGQTRVTSLSSWTLVAALGGPDLAVDRSTAADLVSGLDGYESEMTRLSATVSGPFGFSGSGFEAAQIDTAAISSDTNLQLRVATTLREEAGLVPGCVVEVCGTPLWRFSAVVQALAGTANDLAVKSCPAPQVAGASATNSTTVVVTFDSAIDGVTLSGNGSQFGFDNGLAASSASLSGTNEVTVTTSSMSAVTYTVTVASSLKDVFGVGIDGAHNQTTFTGPTSAPRD